MKSYVQIAKEHHVDTSTVQRYMRKFGLTKLRICWTKQELELLKNKYCGDSEVYRLFPNRSISSVNHKASRLGIEKLVRQRKYRLNHGFFSKWSGGMAYALGFFFSDGNVSSDLQSASIHLNPRDYLILEKIKNVVGSNRPLGIYEHSCYLRLNSKIMSKDLVALGCVPRKSEKLKFPDVPMQFLNSFVRGYFDGDGSINFNKPNTIKISFVGNRPFLEKLQMELNEALNLKNHPISKVKSVWRLLYYGDDARKLCRWMYKHSKGLYLQRKKERFEKHMRLRKNG